MSILDKVVQVAGWIIAASIVVLVITHPGGAAQVITASSGAVTSESKILTAN